MTFIVTLKPYFRKMSSFFNDVKNDLNFVYNLFSATES